MILPISLASLVSVSVLSSSIVSCSTSSPLLFLEFSLRRSWSSLHRQRHSLVSLLFLSPSSSTPLEENWTVGWSELLLGCKLWLFLGYFLPFYNFLTACSILLLTVIFRGITRFCFEFGLQHLNLCSFYFNLVGQNIVSFCFWA